MSDPADPMWRRYLRFFGPDLRRDIDDEIAFHFDERVAELRAQDFDEEGARRRAHEEFGDLPSVRDALMRIDRRTAKQRRHRTRMTTGLGGVWSDLRFALRSLWHVPGLAVAAAGSMALAIGVNITMFAGADAILRPFSVAEPDRLVRIWSSQPQQGWDRGPTSLLDFYDWRDRLASVEIGASRGVAYNWADGDDAERIYGVEVTAGYLALHAVPVLLGREFDRGDEVAAVPIAMIGAILERPTGGGSRRRRRYRTSRWPAPHCCGCGVRAVPPSRPPARQRCLGPARPIVPRNPGKPERYGTGSITPRCDDRNRQIRSRRCGQATAG